MLKAESVCQARAGPCDVDELVELETSCQGGEEGSNGDERSRKRTSLLVGADV